MTSMRMVHERRGDGTHRCLRAVSPNSLWRRIARGITCAALVVASALAAPAHAGGPLYVVNQQPVVYPGGGGTVVLNVDQGTLGSRANADAVALVQAAIDLWNGVGTSTLRLAIGSPLAVDQTKSNYSALFNSFSDGINPVIFDSDGSITNALFGAGASSSILGFAGSAYYTSGPLAGRYAEGRAVLNGALAVSDATWITVLAHEFGHLVGLDHSQLDNVQGLTSNNYVLMYPIAYRTRYSLHEDDAAAVTSLYPSPTATNVYGTLQGSFVTASGAPIRGANIWAREVTTGQVYSSVSDFLTQGSGYFRLLLPAGTYSLRAESIDAGFTGGSSVGPYARSAGDLSFQAPHPIVPVGLGGATLQQISVVPGCLATAVFRLDGTGNVTGNCGSVSAPPAATATQLSSSANPAAAGTTVQLTATIVGSSPGGTVDFRDSGSSIAGCSAVPLTNAGTAVCAVTTLAAGTHSIVAYYSGNAGNAPSASTPLSQVVTVPASTTVLSNGVPVSGLSGAAGSSLTYSIVVPAGASNLVFTTSGGTGEIDLYVRYGSAPTTLGFDCRSRSSGNVERCSIATPRAGTYYASVRARTTAFSGVTLTGAYQGSAANLPPTADFSSTTSGLSASFVDLSTDPDGSITTRNWNFGDGTTSAAASPTKVYAAGGSYSVVLTVTDNAGATTSITKSVTVAGSNSGSSLANGVPLTGISGATYQQLFYTMSVPAGASNLTISISGGTGNANLYVRFGTRPSMTVFDCRSRSSSNQDSCTFATPAAGTYHIGIFGASNFSGVALLGSYQ